MVLTPKKGQISTYLIIIGVFAFLIAAVGFSQMLKTGESGLDSGDKYLTPFSNDADMRAMLIELAKKEPKDSNDKTKYMEIVNLSSEFLKIHDSSEFISEVYYIRLYGLLGAGMFDEAKDLISEYRNNAKYSQYFTDNQKSPISSISLSVFKYATSTLDDAFKTIDNEIVGKAGYDGTMSWPSLTSKQIKTLYDAKVRPDTTYMNWYFYLKLSSKCESLAKVKEAKAALAEKKFAAPC